MSDIAMALNKQGIRLQCYDAGEHRSTCPECSRTRRRWSRFVGQFDGSFKVYSTA